MKPSFDPLVFQFKSTFMQRIADVVRAGYHHYTVGTVPVERAAAFVRKMRDSYHVDLAKDARYRRKAAGLGNAMLLLWRGDVDDSGRLTFALVVTDGDHPAHLLERLHDARRERVQLTGYELALCTRQGSAKPVLTWRMTRATYDGWRIRIRTVARARDGGVELRRAWHSLHSAPGFSALRAQVWKLVELARAEWKRAHGDADFPLPKRRVWYLQRLPNTGTSLSAVIRAEVRKTAQQ